MKRIALLFTALLAVLFASCGDDEPETKLILYGKYAAENVTITENGNTFTSPADVTLYKYDSSQPDSAMFTIGDIPIFGELIKFIVPVHEKGNQISLTGQFKHHNARLGTAFRGTSTGICVPDKINIDLKYTYPNIDESESCYLVPNKTVEIELTYDDIFISPTGSKLLYYNGEFFYRSELDKMAISPALKTVREIMGGSIIGLSYDENGDIKLYSKKDAHSEPEIFKGKFRKIFNLFAADEEGARYVSKKLFGKDEIVKELYSEKLGDYYLANFSIEYLRWITPLHYNLRCYKMNFYFWYAFMLANGKESEAGLLKYIIDEDYTPGAAVVAIGYSID